jgi:hypothetical protein
MTSNIFVSYRREDTAGYSVPLRDRLVRAFGRKAIFVDTDSIQYGEKFPNVVREQVGKCQVLLALIGPHWLNARYEDGNRRLDDPEDFVRIEITTALQRKIPVIPILFDGTKIPKPTNLPSELAELSVCNALDVRGGSFHSDIDRLIQNLRLQPNLASIDATQRLPLRTEIVIGALAGILGTLTIPPPHIRVAWAGSWDQIDEGRIPFGLLIAATLAALFGLAAVLLKRRLGLILGMAAFSVAVIFFFSGLLVFLNNYEFLFLFDIWQILLVGTVWMTAIIFLVLLSCDWMAGWLWK